MGYTCDMYWKKIKKKYRYFGNMIAKSAGRNKNWSRLRANCHEFEGNEPFQIKSPESALKIPLICHIGFAKWPTWWCFTKKNVKKNLKMEKSTFWTPRSKLASLRTKKGPKSLLKAIFHVSILPLDDSGGFWPKFWDRRKKLYIWAGITHIIKYKRTGPFCV